MDIKVANGRDGAPFGEDDQALSWLVSFANCGRRTSSPEENYLLFAANCSEDYLVARRNINLFVQQLRELEQNPHTVILSGEEKTVTYELS